jgi:23S rRNA pseudouridine1911/1915/1917 synthase
VSPKAKQVQLICPSVVTVSDRQKMAIIAVEKGSRNAVTHWQVKERLGNYTLMEFRLETGRTHQIRIHRGHIGHPILGVPLYSSGRSIRINLPGQLLHAHRLILIHPVTGAEPRSDRSLPAIFPKVLAILRQRNP